MTCAPGMAGSSLPYVDKIDTIYLVFPGHTKASMPRPILRPYQPYSKLTTSSYDIVVPGMAGSSLGNTTSSYDIVVEVSLPTDNPALPSRLRVRANTVTVRYTVRCPTELP